MDIEASSHLRNEESENRRKHSCRPTVTRHYSSILKPEPGKVEPGKPEPGKSEPGKKGPKHSSKSETQTIATEKIGKDEPGKSGPGKIGPRQSEFQSQCGTTKDKV